MRLFLPWLFIIAIAASLCRAGEIPVREGDIVFQTFASAQTRAIQVATRSVYNHVGMILMRNDTLMVYEAIGPVGFIPLERWVARDKNRHVVVRRLRNADTLLTASNLGKLREVAATFAGKLYDSAFNWSDEKLYCSELVWKVFHRALALEVGGLRKLKEFDLAAPEVEKKLKERYPGGVPLEETVVSPEDLFQSGLLVTAYQQ
jgi:uncharacterized protein YycO